MTKPVSSADDRMTNKDERGAVRPLSAAARRALDEAAERRALQEGSITDRPKEFAGRNGPEPVRYGDWEVKGLASDF